MRPFLAVLITTTLIGGIYGYTRFTSHIRPARSEVREVIASGQFAIDITLTFDAQGDEFANPSVLIKFQDQVLLERSDRVQAGQPLRISNVDGVQVGENDVFVQVTPEDSTGSNDFDLETELESSAPVELSRAIRVRMFRDDSVVAEKTVWSEPGQPVSGLIPVTVGGAVGQNGDDH